MGVAVSYERGTPVDPLGSSSSQNRRTLELVLQNGLPFGERIFIELMSSDRKLKASREGS